MTTLALASEAAAKTFEVTRKSDPVPGNCKPNDCSLREAVLAANERPGDDRIVLPSRRGAYRLTIPNEAGVPEDGSMTGDLDASNNPLAIVHPGQGRATIEAGPNLDDRLLHVFAGAPVNLVRLRLTGGAAQGGSASGGAILAGGGLKLTRSVLIENSAESTGGAVDMDAEAPLRIVHSALLRNEAESTGGAIRSADGLITIRRSTLQGNRAGSSGGAMRLSGVSPGPVRISRTTIAGNRSGGEGGAIDHDGEESLTITDSTFSGNFAAERGGGIAAGTDLDPLRIVNSTIVGNRTNGFGGGISAVGDAVVNLNAVTVARNRAAANDAGKPLTSGGGLHHDAAQFAVRNSLVALNTIGVVAARNDCFDDDDDFGSSGGNLLSTDLSCEGFTGPGDKFRANPRLGKLARNGGPTKTIALRKGSPAIGNARNSSAPSRDQRGHRRDNNPDSGAFER